MFRLSSTEIETFLTSNMIARQYTQIIRRRRDHQSIPYPYIAVIAILALFVIRFDLDGNYII